MNTLELIEEALTGNLKRFSVLMAVEHNELLQASKTIPVLLLTRLSVLNVLNEIKGTDIAIEIVQGWASFVMRGYIATNASEPIVPIQIDYESEYEDSIVDVLSRLDELGDAVDGAIDETELNSLIHSLA